MSWYERHVLPRISDRLLGAPDLVPWRRRATEGLFGTVLEVGFGSGLNLAVYPEPVTKVYAVDPSLVGRRIAAERVAASPCEVEFVGLDGERIPLSDGSVDGALSTFTLCTIPDVGRALSEVRRVLVADGTFHYLEHGLSPDADVRRWQHRLDPIQRRMFGGCHLTRDVDALIERAGFRILESDRRYAAGPRSHAFFTVGTATAS